MIDDDEANDEVAGAAVDNNLHMDYEDQEEEVVVDGIDDAWHALGH